MGAACSACGHVTGILTFDGGQEPRCMACVRRSAPAALLPLPPALAQVVQEVRDEPVPEGTAPGDAVVLVREPFAPNERAIAETLALLRPLPAGALDTRLQRVVIERDGSTWAWQASSSQGLVESGHRAALGEAGAEALRRAAIYESRLATSLEALRPHGFDNAALGQLVAELRAESAEAAALYAIGEAADLLMTASMAWGASTGTAAEGPLSDETMRRRTALFAAITSELAAAERRGLADVGVPCKGSDEGGRR